MVENAIDRRALADGMRLWRWAAPDGLAHRRMDWPQPGGGAARGSLLFAGGRGDFIEKSVEPLTQWHRRGWHISSFDWRGQGRSRRTPPDPELGDFDILVEDLQALLHDWQRSSPGPYVVAAHSMGAHLLLRAMIAGTPRLDAVVLIAPMIDVNSGALPPRLAARIVAAAVRLGWGGRPLWSAPLARAPAGSKRQRVLTGCVQRYDDEGFWWDQEPAFAPQPPTFGWLNAAYRSARAFTPAALRTIDTPVLVIGATGDRLVSTAAVRRVARRLPRAQLSLFDDCGHELLRERDAVRHAVMARIDGFLDEQAQ